MFSGGDFSDGSNIILDALNTKSIKANFFFTGDYFRKKSNYKFITRLVKNKHYIGAHSDKHLLYVSWQNRDSVLISKTEFVEDLKRNYAEMEKFGIKKENAKIFLPPYEWYNKLIAEWTSELGLKLISFSPGTKSNGDYTIPSMGTRYYSSAEIFNSILDYESSSKEKLNGFHLLLHVGCHPERIDKFYYKLDLLLEELQKRGYTFKCFLDK